jgi:O-acetyl-ADP-ribose deacetylase (regulator of RNase III)
MFLEKIFLVDRNKALVDAWTEAFEGYPEVSCQQTDFFSVNADAMVSPANSFGIMDGGLDLAIRDALGHQIQEAAQKRILERHHGELPVGDADIISTGDSRWPCLVIAPTMRIPEDVSHTVNAYLAFRATLLTILRYNSIRAVKIKSLLCPGLATATGKLSPQHCAAQMLVALREVTAPARIPSFREIHLMHHTMRG